MSFTAQTFITEAQQELTNVGDTFSNADFFLYLNRAIEYFTNTYKIPTTRREHDLLTFSNVHEYPLPSDIRSIIEPEKPYLLHSPRFNHTTGKEFKHWHLDGERTTSIKFIRGTQYLVLNDDTGSSLTVHDFNTVDENGTWAVSGDGSSLAQDKQYFTQGTASLRFTLTGSGGTTTLTNSTFNTVDLTDYVANGFAFLDLQCPSGNTSSITSVELRIGNDASNYYSMSATTRYRGDTIDGGWGLIGFDFSGKSETGSVTDTAIDYAVIIITNPTDGSVDGTYRVDNLFVALPTYYIMPYYSLHNVQNSSGTYQQKVTAAGDTVLCPAGTESAFYYKALELAAIERLSDSGLAEYFRGELEMKENELKTQYPRQNSRPSMTWYKNANRF